MASGYDKGKCYRTANDNISDSEIEEDFFSVSKSKTKIKNNTRFERKQEYDHQTGRKGSGTSYLNDYSSDNEKTKSNIHIKSNSTYSRYSSSYTANDITSKMSKIDINKDYIDTNSNDSTDHSEDYYKNNGLLEDLYKRISRFSTPKYVEEKNKSQYKTIKLKKDECILQYYSNFIRSEKKNKSSDEIDGTAFIYNDKKNDSKYFIGNQGLIFLRFPTGVFRASSTLIFLPNDTPWKNRKPCILTCAHIFLHYDPTDKFWFFPEAAIFLHELNDNCANQAHISDYCVYPRYNTTSTDDWANDLAVAFYDSSISAVTKNDIIDCSLVESGNKIYIAGYPSLKGNDKPFYMKGKITNIDSLGYSAVINTDVFTLPGQEGSPVYFKLPDKTWRTIGVLVKCGNHSKAVGFTEANIKWLNEKAKEKNNN